MSNRLPPEVLLQIVSFSVAPASYHAWTSRSGALRSYCTVSTQWRDVAQALLIQAPVIKTEAVAQRFLARLGAVSIIPSSSLLSNIDHRVGELDLDRDDDDDDDDAIRNQVIELRLGDNEIFTSWTNGFSNIVSRCKRLKRLYVLNADQVILAELGHHSNLHYFYGCNLQFAPPAYYSIPLPPASPSLAPPPTPLQIPPLVLPLRFMSLSHSGLPLLISPNSLPHLTHLSLYDVYRSYGLDDAIDPDINNYALLLRTLGPQLKAAKLDLVLYPSFDFDTWLPTLASESRSPSSNTPQDDRYRAGGRLQLFQVSSYEAPSLFLLLQACQSLEVIIADVFPLDRDTRTHLLGPTPHSFVGHANLRKIRFRRGPILVDDSREVENYSVDHRRFQQGSAQEENKLIQSVWGEGVKVVYDADQSKEGRQRWGLEDEEARFGLTFEAYCLEEGVRIE
ncbi:BZ3500_MvSof-1268-A1-R1_Chr1-3g01716 [Microbotryum saponariae]|uniref:BZ3500_MvSof-1268-A1-R1_Chr1-3g01716 protein n=1 Tax=Microbotryum saponariae TaxID=289078 RepID=A0A2X0KUU0_9BASI|nr:BZ3500_MvSof-1268-A1-R1_Chr1-3g01716 [Microbotryum saponariae]SCZ94413.1 BZ3501_MvSof-1269-A2-R1_Chr1-3g01317 [Microbotryum saponariae]